MTLVRIVATGGWLAAGVLLINGSWRHYRGYLRWLTVCVGFYAVASCIWLTWLNWP